MTEKVDCTRCGTKILPDTFEKTGGLCMPCAKDRAYEIQHLKVIRRPHPYVQNMGQSCYMA